MAETAMPPPSDALSSGAGGGRTSERGCEKIPQRAKTPHAKAPRRRGAKEKMQLPFAVFASLRLGGKLQILSQLQPNVWARLSLRDVRNEGRTGYVYENTGDDDKMSSEIPAFYTNLHLLCGHRQVSIGLLTQNAQLTRLS